MKKFLIALATVAALVFAGGSSNPAMAEVDDLVAWFVHDDGSYTKLIEKFTNKDGKIRYKWEHYDNDENLIEWGYVNPNPEGDGGTEPGDEKSRLNLALQKGGELIMTAEFTNTPLGKYLIGKGTGLVPVYQPSDDESGGPSTGMTGTSLLDAKDQMETKLPAGFLADIPYDPNSGSVQEYFMSKLPKGPPPETDTGGDDDGSNDKLGTDAGVLFGDLPGPPELVNPDPVTSSGSPEMQPSAAAQLPSDAAEGGGAGRTTAPSTATIVAPKQ